MNKHCIETDRLYLHPLTYDQLKMYLQNDGSLEKELGMMQNLIDVEKSSRAMHLNMQVHVAGSLDDKYIVPMTLFTLLENCFKAMDNKKTNKPTITLDIKIKTNDLYVSMIMSEGKTANNNISYWRHIFRNTSQRLDALYPDGCRLNMKEEKQSFIVLLHVALKNNIGRQSNYPVAQELKHGVYENS